MGIPSIWATKDKKEIKVIGSIKELIEEIDLSVSVGIMKSNPFQNFKVDDMSDENYKMIDLHKHVLDKIKLASKNNSPMFREKDLIDVWFDSGAMPYAQWHYPFENKQKIDKGDAFPADYIAEGVDQTRGWFYTLHIISNIVFNSVAYKNVISNGLVLDKTGQKMSKRLGNAIDPFKTINIYGADATRWYMISNSNPWDNLKFELSGVEEVRRKFLEPFLILIHFLVSMQTLINFVMMRILLQLKNVLNLTEWIISELNSLIDDVDSAYNDYEPTKAAELFLFCSREIK